MITESQANHLIRELHKISHSLAKLALVVDVKKKTLRMVDVDRGKVYKTHLGKKLTK